MKLAASRELHSYWNSLRGGRSAPERNEVDPVAIRGVLADTFILEMDAAARFPFRVAGTRTNTLFLKELRGEPFLDIWAMSDQRDVVDLLDSVAGDALAIVAGVMARAPGLRPLELELLLLPLRHRGATHSRILGCCAPASIPSWLGLVPVGPLSLHSLRVLSAEGKSESKSNSLAGPEDQPQIFSRTAEVKRHGHLFVHSSMTPRG